MEGCTGPWPLLAARLHPLQLGPAQPTRHPTATSAERIFLGLMA